MCQKRSLKCTSCALDRVTKYFSYPFLIELQYKGGHYNNINNSYMDICLVLFLLLLLENTLQFNLRADGRVLYDS